MNINQISNDINQSINLSLISRTRNKIILGFVITFCFLMVATITTMFQANTIVRTNKHTNEVAIPSSLSALSILNGINQSLAGLRGWMITNKEEVLNEQREAWHIINEQISFLNSISKRWISEPNKQRLKKITQEIDEFNVYQKEVITIFPKNPEQGEQILALQTIPSSLKIKDLLEKLHQEENAIMQQFITKSNENGLFLQNLQLLLLIAGTFTSIAVAYTILKLVEPPLKQAIDFSSTLNKQNWVKTASADIAESIQGLEHIEAIAGTLLNKLATSIDAKVGVFYYNQNFSLEDSEKQAKDEFRLINSYAFKTRKHVTNTYSMGEGIVGQAALEKQPILLTDVPEDYIQVNSGLGKVTPKNILVTPITYEDKTIAVIELGTLTALNDQQQDIVRIATENLGIILRNIYSNMRTKELLEETRVTAEELQTREEELKTQQEELESTNEELTEKTNILEERNKEIEQQTSEIEKQKNALEKRTQELMQSGKYKSEFLANMSHELRTPLNSLLILAKNFVDNEEGNLNEEQIEDANVIYNGGIELLNLINDILDLSKVEAGKLNILVEKMPLTSLVKRMSQHFTPVAKKSGVTFATNIADSTPDYIYTDIQRIEQIMKNLLSNAFKFTSKGEVSLNIYAPDTSELNTLANVDKNEPVIAFAVKDSGIGIAKDKLKDVFEAFQQENGATDRHYGGTGLGLTICRKFSKLLHGELTVTSEKGKGSTFTFYTNKEALKHMDQNEENSIQIETHSDSESTATKHSDLQAIIEDIPTVEVMNNYLNDDRDTISDGDKVLLIIEDDKDFAKILLKISQNHGYKVIVAENGKYGLLYAMEYNVNAIVLDLMLPDIDGMEVLEHLKQHSDTRHIPVHILSANDNINNVIPLRKGAIGYLNKPASNEDIQQIFDKIESVENNKVSKVLVIEDDPTAQKAIKKLLGKSDTDVIFSESGKEGIKKAKEEEYQCIVLDLRLPDMTGFEWLAYIEKEKISIPPVIIYTGKELSEEENRELNQHTGSIIIKGVNSSERLIDEVTLFLHSVESSLTEEQKQVISMNHDPKKVLQNKKVLLVDDDLRNTFALSKTLKKHGLEIIVADNGQMALDKLEENPEIELVIMDVMMPVMDGFEAIRHIRANKDMMHIPIIALTARAMPEEQDRCIEAGANDYLTKPVNLDRLLNLMRVWLFKVENRA